MMRALGVLATMTALGACNALTGAHDRFLDEGLVDRDDAGTEPQGDSGITMPSPIEGGTTPGPDATTAQDTGKPKVTKTITVPQVWISKNGASTTVDGTGTKITALEAAHPIIIPSTLPAVPSPDYTVLATVLATADGEFGILARVRDDGSGFVLGSKFGVPVTPFPFLGFIAPADWNPSLLAQGLPYTFLAGKKWKMKIVCAGPKISGKMWREDENEPAADFSISDGSTTAQMGKNVGFYTYNLVDATLVDLKILYEE